MPCRWAIFAASSTGLEPMISNTPPSAMNRKRHRGCATIWVMVYFACRLASKMAMISGPTWSRVFSLEILGLEPAIGADAERNEGEIGQRHKRERLPGKGDKADDGQGAAAQNGKHQITRHARAHGLSRIGWHPAHHEKCNGHNIWRDD